MRHWIKITEMLSESVEPDAFNGQIFYSAISQTKLKAILQGKMEMPPPSYWTPHYDLVDYYAETIRDEGEQSEIVGLEISRFDVDGFGPDMPSIEEPINTFVRRLHGFGAHQHLIPDPENPNEHLDIEEWVWKQWQSSTHDYKASLELVGSCVYRKPLKITAEDVQR